MKIARHRNIKKVIIVRRDGLAMIMYRIWVNGTEFRRTREAAAPQMQDRQIGIQQQAPPPSRGMMSLAGEDGRGAVEFVCPLVWIVSMPSPERDTQTDERY